MSRMDKQAIINLCNQINKKEGKGSIYTLGSENANLKINRWSRGIGLDCPVAWPLPSRGWRMF